MADAHDDEQYRAMIEKEFDVRYNLIHPNIVIITDYEDVPGVGRCIVTDDVYGNSLRKLIGQKQITPQIIDQLRHQLVSAIDYIQSNHIVHHPIRPETIIFTEIGGKLKLIDVGFDQRANLHPAEASEDIFNYGKVLLEAIEASGDSYPLLRKVAERCLNPDPRKRYRDVQELKLALEQRSSNRLYVLIIIFLSIMTLLLAWFNSPYRPTPPNQGKTSTETTIQNNDNNHNHSDNGN